MGGFEEQKRERESIITLWSENKRENISADWD